MSTEPAAAHPAICPLEYEGAAGSCQYGIRNYQWGGKGGVSEINRRVPGWVKVAHLGPPAVQFRGAMATPIEAPQAGLPVPPRATSGRPRDAPLPLRRSSFSRSLMFNLRPLPARSGRTINLHGNRRASELAVRLDCFGQTASEYRPIFLTRSDYFWMPPISHR